MMDISEIIKEAKPLYFRRKRQKQSALLCLPFLVCFFTLGGISVHDALEIRANEMNALYIGLYDSAQFDELFSSVNGVIEEMGLPVDDFGLLAAL